MRSRTFLNVSLALLALALAYHFGARSATAQSPASPIVATGDSFVYAANGDAYTWTSSAGPWVYVGNVFAGGPTPITSQESFGSVKARFRGAREPRGVKPSTGR